MIRYTDIQDEELQDAYRRVYNTEDGRRVFAHMLGYLGMFEPIRRENLEEDAAMRNVATWLLEQIGMSHEANLELIAENLLSVESIRIDKEATNRGTGVYG